MIPRALGLVVANKVHGCDEDTKAFEFYRRFEQFMAEHAVRVPGEGVDAGPVTWRTQAEETPGFPLAEQPGTGLADG